VTASSFEALNRERTNLILDVMEAETATFVTSHDEELSTQVEAARRALDAWNRIHAADYNALKPWYMARARRTE